VYSVHISSVSGPTVVDELLIAGRSASDSAATVGKFDSTQLPTEAQLACNVNTRLIDFLMQTWFQVYNPYQ